MPKAHLPTKSEKDMIRRVLNLPVNHPFPLCPGKDKAKVKSFEASGNYEHSSPSHVCDQCRCHRVAGSGTYGEYLLPGRPELGSYGCGFCSKCAKTREKSVVDRERALAMESMKRYGTSLDTTEKVERAIRMEAEQANENQEVRDALTRVRETIKTMDEVFTPEHNERRVQALQQIFERLGDIGTDDDQLADLLKETQRVVVGVIDSNGLTERGTKGPIPMSDDTKFRLMMQQAKLLNELGKSKFDMSKEFMIPLDVLKRWQLDVLQIIQRIAPTKKDYELGVELLKKAITKTNNVNMGAAAHEIEVEAMNERSV
jgi:hypothetical protein